MNHQTQVGKYVQQAGQLLLIGVALFCCVDVGFIGERGGLLMPLNGYFALIFAGVAAQFLGAAIPNMPFAPGE